MSWKKSENVLRFESWNEVPQGVSTLPQTTTHQIKDNSLYSYPTILSSFAILHQIRRNREPRTLLFPHPGSQWLVFTRSPDVMFIWLFLCELCLPVAMRKRSLNEVTLFRINIYNYATVSSGPLIWLVEQGSKSAYVYNNRTETRHSAHLRSDPTSWFENVTTAVLNTRSVPETRFALPCSSISNCSRWMSEWKNEGWKDWIHLWINKLKNVCFSQMRTFVNVRWNKQKC